MTGHPERALRLAWAVAGLLAAGAAHAGALRADWTDAGWHVRAGQAVTRTVLIENSAATTAALRLAWTLAVPPLVVDSGRLETRVPPRGRAALPLRLRLPPAWRTVEACLLLSAQDAPGSSLTLAGSLRVYPPDLELPWAFLRTRRIGVVDRQGALTARLRALGGRPEMLRTPAEAAHFTGDLLVIGEQCLASGEEWAAWRAALWRGRAGCVVLDQSSRAGPGAKPVLPDEGPPVVLPGVEPADLAGWPGGALRAVPRAQSLPGGRLLLTCPIPLLERWETEPACELLLNALLREALEGKDPPPHLK